MEGQKDPFKADHHVHNFEVWNPPLRSRRVGVMHLRHFFCAVRAEIVSQCLLQIVVSTRRCLKAAVTYLQDVVSSER